MNGKKNRINPEKLGLWECCDGVWYTAAGRCSKCGKTAQDKASTAGKGTSAGVSKPKSESDIITALDFQFKEQAFVPRDDAKYIVVLCRGYSGLQLDEDNLVASFKSLRDAIAEKILKMDTDAEKAGLQWEYRQIRGIKGTTIAIYRREGK